MAPRSALAPAGAIPTQAGPPPDPDVVAAVAGDRDAFMRLYERYLDVVFRYVMFRLHANQRQQLAEDLTAETFTRAFVNIGRFQWNGTDFGAWLVTIARNMVADHYKAAATKRTALTQTGDVNDADRADTAHGPEHLAVLAGARRDLRKALGTLTPMQRQVVLLRYGQDLTTAETAAALGTNEGVVKACLHRAVRALQRRLTEAGVTA